MAAQPRNRLLTFNDPHPMRIDRDLAAEIGLNESILLLQIEYLISISSNERDGRLWTYQSLANLRETYFPWWSMMTISRTLRSLEEKRLLLIGNFNKLGYDRTQWFALNEEGINLLHSVAIYQNGKSIYQNGDIDPNKMLNDIYQNVTTIPESTREYTESNKSEGRKKANEGRPAQKRGRPPTQGSLDSLHEAVIVYKEFTGKREVPPTTATLIASTVVEIPAWRIAVKAWCDKGNKPGNVEGMIDWYLYPERQQRGNVNGKHIRPGARQHSERGTISETDLDKGF